MPNAAVVETPARRTSSSSSASCRAESAGRPSAAVRSARAGSSAAEASRASSGHRPAAERAKSSPPRRVHHRAESAFAARTTGLSPAISDFTKDMATSSHRWRGALAGHRLMLAASSSEPPAIVGLACRPVGAWRRHLVKLDSFTIGHRHGAASGAGRIPRTRSGWRPVACHQRCGRGR